MDYRVEDILNDYFEDKEYDTEEEMLGQVDMVVEDLVQDAYRWGRRFRADPERNAEDLDIKVKEYQDEEENEEI